MLKNSKPETKTSFRKIFAAAFCASLSHSFIVSLVIYIFSVLNPNDSVSIKELLAMLVYLLIFMTPVLLVVFAIFGLPFLVLIKKASLRFYPFLILGGLGVGGFFAFLIHSYNALPINPLISIGIGLLHGGIFTIIFSLFLLFLLSRPSAK